MADTASSSSPGLLPTPLAADAGPRGGTTGYGLRDTVRAMLPPPRATDGTKGGPNQRGSSGDLMLPSAVAQLLPTPTAETYGSNQSLSPGAAVRPSLDTLVGTLLPTPDATHGRHGAPAQTGTTLTDALHLLPTPEAKNAHARQDYARADRPGSGGPDLITAAMLLPTPSAGDGERNRRAAAGPTPDGGWRQVGLADALLPTPTAAAEDGVDWGQYTGAVRRWEELHRPAPVPWERGPRGGLRLAPALPEWMMDYPPGWVTEVPGLARTEQLRLLGNGVVHRQAVAALHVLLPVWQQAIA